MKKNKILLALLMSSCVSAVAGCGENTYKINVKINNTEYGYVTGGGSYASGSKASIKIYPNEGCTKEPTIYLRRANSDVEETITNGIQAQYNDSNRLDHFEYSFNVDPSENGTVGDYRVAMSCESKETPEGEPTDATRTVEFFVKPESSNEGYSKITVNGVDSEIEFGKKLKRIDYVDGYEGKFTWYTKDSSDHLTLYNFDNPVETDLKLYATIPNQAVSQIISEAIEFFDSSEKTQMSMGTYTAKVKRNKDGKIEEFHFVDIATVNSKPSYFIKGKDGINYSYYEVDGSEYYSVDLSTSGFVVENIETYSMFFNHKSALNAGNKYERVMQNNTHVMENVTVGKDKNNNDIVIKCYKYRVLDANDIELMTLWIKNGKLYKTESGTGENKKVNIINYPSEITTMSFEQNRVSPMYLVKLESNDGDLNTRVNVNNNNFANILKIKPNKGEKLDELLEFKDGNLYISGDDTEISLREYDYEFVRSDGRNLKDSVSSHVTVKIEVKSEISHVTSALDKLKNGGYRIKTSMNGIFEDQVLSTSFFVPEGSNVFALDQKPSGMEKVIWSTIGAINSVYGENNGYHHFRYNADTSTYSFYRGENNNDYPYLSIQTNKVTGDVVKIIYNEIVGPESRALTTVFEYEYNSYITSLNNLKNVGYTIKTGSVEYLVEEQEDLLQVIKVLKPEDMSEDMFNDLKLLNKFVGDKYILKVNGNVYTFTDVDDNTNVYTITLSGADNLTISTYKVGSTTYEFQYSEAN